MTARKINLGGLVEFDKECIKNGYNGDILPMSELFISKYCQVSMVLETTPFSGGSLFYSIFDDNNSLREDFHDKLVLVKHKIRILNHGHFYSHVYIEERKNRNPMVFLRADCELDENEVIGYVMSGEALDSDDINPQGRCLFYYVDSNNQSKCIDLKKTQKRQYLGSHCVCVSLPGNTVQPLCGNIEILSDGKTHCHFPR